MPVWLAIVLGGIGLVVLLLVVLPWPKHYFMISDAGEEDSGKLKRWLDMGLDPNRKGLLGQTALYWAVHDGQLNNVVMLLERGADPNLTSANFLPLVVAARQGQVRISESLLEAGADPNLQDGSGNSALETAALWGTPEVLLKLLQHGGNPNLKISDGDPLICRLLVRIVNEDDESTKTVLRQNLGVLLAKGANPNVRDTNDCPLLYNAGYDEPSLRMLIDAGVILDTSHNGINLRPNLEKLIQKWEQEG